MMCRLSLILSICVAHAIEAQTAAVIRGRTVDTAGAPVAASLSVRAAAVEVAHGTSASDGSFQISLPTLPGQVTIDARTRENQVALLSIDSAAVRTSAERPIIIRLKSLASMPAVNVRAHFQRRPSVFNFFEGEPSSRIEPAGPATTPWLDPFDAADLQAMLRASPELMLGADGSSSILGASGSSNQLQIGGVRVPSGLVSGTLGGTIAVSPWDAAIGGVAGATVNLYVSPAGRYRTAYATVRSGMSVNPVWNRSDNQPGGSGIGVPAQLSIGASGPVGKFGYHASVFVKGESTPLSDWDRVLDGQPRRVLDSVSSTLGQPVVRSGERSVDAGMIARMDFLPSSDSKRVLALTSGLSRSSRDGGTGRGLVTSSVGNNLVEDVGLLQLESTRVLGERVLWTSLLSTSLTASNVQRVSDAPTIVVTDTTTGNVFVTGGSPLQPKGADFASEAKTTATWYSTDNRTRYVAQLQMRFERASLGGRSTHATFAVPSFSALEAGHAVALLQEGAADPASASSFVLAPAASARYDIGKNGSLLLGLRADGWTTSGVATSGELRSLDISPRVSLLRRIGTRSANRGPIATLRVGAGRFTDWPGLQQWSDVWRGVDESREVCAGASVPAVSVSPAAGACSGQGTVQTINRTIADSYLRPSASNRADISVSLAQVAPGVRAELGAAFAQNTRMAARVSPLANALVIDRLPGEDGRAILVPATSISSDGTVAPAPVPSDLVNVTRLASEARSNAAQWRIRLATRDPFASVTWDATYVLTTGTERSLAVASPYRSPTFVSGPLSAGGRHTIALSLSEWIGDAQIRLAGIARSGIRFTPLADRDLNGDGRANDAAFVPQAQSAAWANVVSPSIRDCIRAAAGRIAGVNSCSGPWSISSLVLASIPGGHLGLPNGSSLELQLSNPLAAIFDMNGVTFGSTGAVNATLVHVTGFDSASHRFTGVPLKGFGKPLALLAGSGEPVRFALGVRVPLGRSVTSQKADAVISAFQKDTSSRGRRGAALQYVSDLPPFPILVLQSADALQLTAEQKKVLQGLAARWQASAARVVVGAYDDGGIGKDARTARDRVVQARAEFLHDASDIAAQIRQTLSPDQAELLPDGIQRLLNPRFLQFLAQQDSGTF